MLAVLIAVAFVSIVYAIAWYLQRANLRQHINKIPGPPCVPILGNAHQMIGGPEWYEQVLKWGQKFQDQGVFKFWLVTKPVLGIVRAECAEVVLNSSKHMDKSSEYEFLHPWLGTGLLTSTGDKWRTRRKMLTPTFHFRILHDFQGVFNHQTAILLRKLQTHIDQEPFNIFQDITRCALDIICETAMGQHVSAQTKDSEYVRAVYKACSLIERRTRTPWYWNKTLYDVIGYGKEHDRCLQILHNFTRKVITDRMSTFDPKSTEAVLQDKEIENESQNEFGKKNKKRLAFLDMLLYMALNDKTLTVQDIQEEVDTFMFEGHDTTAAAMNWAIYLIGSHPKVQTKVHEELDIVFGTSDRLPSMDDLKELRYLECCIKEALRLYPSVPYYGRTTTEEAHFGPYTVPKDITVVVFAAAIHRDARWFSNPDEFEPERFMPEISSKRHPYSFIPFSGGLRNCIGQKFALQEEKVVLSSIFRRFHVTAIQKREELLPLGELILRPKDGIVVKLSTRKD